MTYTGEHRKGHPGQSPGSWDCFWRFRWLSWVSASSLTRPTYVVTIHGRQSETNPCASPADVVNLSGDIHIVMRQPLTVPRHNHSTSAQRSGMLPAQYVNSENKEDEWYTRPLSDHPNV
jgi:hypothetical protein